MQDNDPKYTSSTATNINWWRTAPKSPDLNPVENLWHEIKEFIRRDVKPKSKEELIEEGIQSFWKTVDVAVLLACLLMNKIYSGFTD